MVVMMMMMINDDDQHQDPRCRRFVVVRMSALTEGLERGLNLFPLDADDDRLLRERSRRR